MMKRSPKYASQIIILKLLLRELLVLLREKSPTLMAAAAVAAIKENPRHEEVVRLNPNQPR